MIVWPFGRASMARITADWLELLAGGAVAGGAVL